MAGIAAAYSVARSPPGSNPARAALDAGAAVRYLASLLMVSRSKHVVHIVMPATAGRTAFAWGTTRVLNAQPAGA
jgi:hypothetical protein